LFVETYPFYIGHSKQSIWDFNYGDWVVNVNSHTKNFINFGDIGTVIGFTAEEVIILFDTENLSLSNLYDWCKVYRGGMVKPDWIINMTKLVK